jgi:hypothetical protein
MDTPIKLELTLEARGGEIRGLLTQSDELYVVEIQPRSEGGFSTVVHNHANGTKETVTEHVSDLDAAIEDALGYMGALAHNSFPGYGPAEEN